jgi:hypothetical protein
MRVEHGIVHNATPDELHRGPMTGTKAREWIKEFEEDGGKPGAFVIVYRTVSTWQRSAINDE